MKSKLQQFQKEHSSVEYFWAKELFISFLKALIDV